MNLNILMIVLSPLLANITRVNSLRIFFMEIYLHIGHPKSGSTFLQYHFFNVLNVHFIGRPYSKEAFDIEKIIAASDNTTFKKNKAKIIKFFQRVLKSKQKNVISIEDLTKPTFLTQKKGHNIFKCLKRYYKILSNFGDVKIIYVIRSHTEIISSFYEQYYLEDWKFYNITHDKVVNFFKYKKFSKELSFLFNSFNYSKNFTKLQNIFGDNKVKILFYEDLKFDYVFFKNEIINFMGLDENIIIQKQIANASTEKSSYLRLGTKIVKNIIIRNFRIFDDIKREFNDLKLKIYEIKFRKKILKNFKIDIRELNKEIRQFYKNDCMRFKNKNFINKLKKYNYL